MATWEQFLREYFSQAEYTEFALSLDEMIVCFLAEAYESNKAVQYGRKGFDLIAFEVNVGETFLSIPIEELEGRGFALIPWDTPEEYLARHWNIF